MKKLLVILALSLFGLGFAQSESEGLLYLLNEISPMQECNPDFTRKAYQITVIDPNVAVCFSISAPRHELREFVDLYLNEVQLPPDYIDVWFVDDFGGLSLAFLDGEEEPSDIYLYKVRDRTYIVYYHTVY